MCEASTPVPSMVPVFKVPCRDCTCDSYVAVIPTDESFEFVHLVSQPSSIPMGRNSPRLRMMSPTLTWRPAECVGRAEVLLVRSTQPSSGRSLKEQLRENSLDSSAAAAETGFETPSG